MYILYYILFFTSCYIILRARSQRIMRFSLPRIFNLSRFAIPVRKFNHSNFAALAFILIPINYPLPPHSPPTYLPIFLPSFLLRQNNEQFRWRRTVSSLPKKRDSQKNWFRCFATLPRVRGGFQKKARGKNPAKLIQHNIFFLCGNF